MFKVYLLSLQTGCSNSDPRFLILQTFMFGPTKLYSEKKVYIIATHLPFLIYIVCFFSSYWLFKYFYNLIFCFIDTRIRHK